MDLYSFVAWIRIHYRDADPNPDPAVKTAPKNEKQVVVFFR